MKSSTRTATIALSVALCGAATVAYTHASTWPFLRSLTGETRSPAKIDTAASASALASATTPAATGPATTSASSVQVAANSQTYRDGTYTGSPFDAYYGIVRVQVQIQSGRIASIHVLEYPSDNGTSRYINSLALPYLRSEVIQAQTVFVNMVSGATLSSNAFLHSTYAALQAARS